MRLPKDITDLEVEVTRIKNVCKQSQQERAQFYRNLRQTYLYGTNVAHECKKNMVAPIINRFTSFLVGAGHVNFWVNLGSKNLLENSNVPASVYEALQDVTSLASMDDEALAKLLSQIQFGRIDAVADHLKEAWEDTGLDLDTVEATRWSCVFGCYIIGAFAERQTDGKNEVTGHLIAPEDFGVYNEAQPDISRQQAVVMSTMLTKADIEMRIWGHPNRKAILEGLKPAPPMKHGIGRVWAAASTDTEITGAPIGSFTGNFNYDATPQDQLYEVDETYIWDDVGKDWRVFQTSGDNLIFDRMIDKMGGVSGLLPFKPIRPFGMPKYFWGWSLVDGLTKPQNWYSDRLNQFDRMMEKALDPPFAISGVGGLEDEKINALNEPGGLAFLGQPGSTAQQFKIDIPPQILDFFKMIEDYFISRAGMYPSLFGKQDPGTRTEGMLANMMRVTASEIKNVALTVEKQIETVAQILYLMKREYEDIELIDDQGISFVLHEFPIEARIKVDGHSASPIFMEDRAQMVAGLLREGAIDQTMAIEMLNPPMKEMILHKLRPLQMAKTIAAEIVKQQQAQKRSGKQ